MSLLIETKKDKESEKREIKAYKYINNIIQPKNIDSKIKNYIEGKIIVDYLLEKKNSKRYSMNNIKILKNKKCIPFDKTKKHPDFLRKSMLL